ncbi:MAG: FIST N-terminal domain-containing protein [Actinomycetota bacterium]
MFKMAVGHSDDIDPEDAARAIIEQCQEALGGVTPTAAVLFSAFDSEVEPVLRAVREAFPDIELIGSTSSAEMSSVLGYQEDSVTLAVFATDSVDITGGVATDIYSDVGVAAHTAVEQARAKTDKEPRLCIVTPSVGGDTRALLGALREVLGEDVSILGGGASPQSNRMAAGESFQFFGERVLQGAAPLLLFSGPLTFSFGVDTGWRPIGPRGRVTRAAAGGTVHEIDGEPALAFYQRYLGEGFLPAFANPLAVFEDGAESFYLRAPTWHDPESGIIRVSGSLPEGAEVQLTMAATDEIFDGARSALSQAIGRFPGREPDAALIFSCAIRKHLLGTRTGTEYDITHDMLGAAVPICGFYSFGEIAPFDAGGEIRFHNATLVALLLGAD